MTITFELIRMMILAARYAFEVKESDGAICFDL